MIIIYRLGSIVADYDIVYDSTNDKFEDSLVQASVDLASGSNLTYDGKSVVAKTGAWLRHLFYLLEVLWYGEMLKYVQFYTFTITTDVLSSYKCACYDCYTIMYIQQQFVISV